MKFYTKNNQYGGFVPGLLIPGKSTPDGTGWVELAAIRAEAAILTATKLNAQASSVIEINATLDSVASKTSITLNWNTYVADLQGLVDKLNTAAPGYGVWSLDGTAVKLTPYADLGITSVDLKTTTV